MKRKTSDALVEVRTVASRARTALETIRRLPEERRRHRADGRALLERTNGERGQDMADLTGFWAKMAEDPDEGAMIAALGQVVSLLERWQ
ncbi:MAG: hypothetical protein EKK55_16285 [Rhodocyclaceae bacterium]|nr:MAG: hypothetical protein EKK55_16285 [Rhodocyclaceae bacterium]